MNGAGDLLPVRVTARAGREEIAGLRDGVLLVKVSAPPAEGRANEAVLRLIARSLGVARSEAELVRGARSREKLVRIRGLSAAQALERLGL